MQKIEISPERLFRRNIEITGKLTPGVKGVGVVGDQGNRPVNPIISTTFHWDYARKIALADVRMLKDPVHSIVPKRVY